jgi:hypothetical protein
MESSAIMIPREGGEKLRRDAIVTRFREVDLLSPISGLY